MFKISGAAVRIGRKIYGPFENVDEAVKWVNGFGASDVSIEVLFQPPEYEAPSAPSLKAA